MFGVENNPTEPSLKSYSAGSADLSQRIRSAKILIVDDVPIMCRLIGTALTKVGFENITFAFDGKEALLAVEQARPDLIILDLNMPKMNGYEVCRHLRSLKNTRDLPILVQSAAETAEERAKVFEAGGTDFVSKPINEPEMIARVRLHLENRFLIQNLSHFYDRMQGELSIAHDMQRDLMPSDNVIWGIQQKYGIQIESFYRASSELSGDLWGVWPIDNERLGLYTLDIVGHGVGAAMNTFRVHEIMNRHTHLRGDPAAFLSALNQELTEVFPTGQYGTMFYGVIDFSEQKITYVGAASPKPFIIGHDRRTDIRTIDTSGIPVGITNWPDYENQDVDFHPSEVLFCYSDALIETENISGEILSETGLRGLIADNHEKFVDDELLPTLLGEFYRQVPRILEDDLTAICVHFLDSKTIEDWDEVSTTEAETFQILALVHENSNVEKITSLNDDQIHFILAKNNDETGGHLLKAEQIFHMVLMETPLTLQTVRDWIGYIRSQSTLRGIPIVVINNPTWAVSDEKLLSMGADYILSPNVSQSRLKQLIVSVSSRYDQIVQIKRKVEWRRAGQIHVKEGMFNFSSRREAQALAAILSVTCSDPLLASIGLMELMVNAVEHGCLSIGRVRKAELVECGDLSTEMHVRSSMSIYRDMQATIQFVRRSGYVEFTITDPGEGFDYLQELEMYKENHTEKSGRGIFMATRIFSSLKYDGKGNKLIATMDIASQG